MAPRLDHQVNTIAVARKSLDALQLQGMSDGGGEGKPRANAVLVTTAWYPSRNAVPRKPTDKKRKVSLFLL